MNLSQKEIIIQNIEKCSADTFISSAEIELLISEFVFDNDFLHKSIFDIKNEIQQKFEILTNSTKISKYDMMKYKLNICTLLQTYIRVNFDLPISSPDNFNQVKIAYWHSNAYCKEAFNTFCNIFSNCNEIQLESFSSVCENILDDETFGIIPVINSNDGRLMSFYKLLDKYDLKVSVTHDVETPNGDGFTKFALVGRKLVGIKPKEYKNIELSVSDDISSLLYILELVGGNVKEITSVPSPHNKLKPINYITLCVKSDKVYSLGLFLYIFGGDFDFIGISSEL